MFIRERKAPIKLKLKLYPRKCEGPVSYLYSNFLKRLLNFSSILIFILR